MDFSLGLKRWIRLWGNWLDEIMRIANFRKLAILNRNYKLFVVDKIRPQIQLILPIHTEIKENQ